MTELTKEQKLALIYRHTHKDFKGSNASMGKTILIFRNGTCLVSLDNLTDAEIEEKLPSAIRMEAKRKEVAAKKVAK